MPRSEVVSVSSLTKSIDKAVALAAKRHNVKLGSETFIRDWEILGRILREMNQLGPAGPTDVAATIAKAAGLKGTPVSAKIGRDILVGVIPYDLNVQIGR